MKTDKKNYAVCPCCLTPTHRTEMSYCLALQEKLERKIYHHIKEIQSDPFNSFINSNFKWACDSCLQTGKAIIATPELQKTGINPHLAYTDTQLKCRNCGTVFHFKKEEKKQWYEQLKFLAECKPVNCLQCRRNIRELKKENKVLSDILKNDLNNMTIEDLQKTIEIYRKWGKPEKVKFYEAIIRKKA